VRCAIKHSLLLFHHTSQIPYLLTFVSFVTFVVKPF
jgi:hypothetical protein